MECQSQILEHVQHTSLICRICGDVARGMNFGVITCMSCKAFFRRHALKNLKKLQCPLDDNCDVSKRSRSGCSACRLKKCFILGMNSKLIRSPHKQIIKQQKTIALPQPKPLSLLNNDRSTLTFDEWGLLSNIIHAYDEQELLVRTQCSLREQSSLPPKLRVKKHNTLDLIGSFYAAVQPFIERSTYFHNLPSSLRRVIIENNLCGTGAFNSFMTATEANVYDNEDYISICNEIYGVEYVQVSYNIIKRIESNRTLLKLMLIVLAFSSNASLVSFDQSIKLTNRSTIQSIYLIRIQNVFVTMLWKYIVYQYGFVEAVRRFSCLVKSFLDTLSQIERNVSTQHMKMVDDIVEKTLYSLKLED
ncbi:hypothetical protein I4U23_013701 [Adineta vaga]|nr:hypothetical protein I4U23_013701 [Adineta vaga]